VIVLGVRGVGAVDQPRAIAIATTATATTAVTAVVAIAIEAVLPRPHSEARIRARAAPPPAPSDVVRRSHAHAERPHVARRTGRDGPFQSMLVTTSSSSS